MLKKSNKISLEEATRLAILGKLPLMESKTIKKESTTVTATEDGLTVVDSDEATVVVEPKSPCAGGDCGTPEVAPMPVEEPVEPMTEPVADEPITEPVEEPVEDLSDEEPFEYADEDLDESKKVENKEVKTEGEAPLFKKKINKTDIKKVENKEVKEEAKKDEPKRNVINKVDLTKTEGKKEQTEAVKKFMENLNKKRIARQLEAKKIKNCNGKEVKLDKDLGVKIAEGLTKFLTESYKNGKEIKVEKVVNLTENKLYVKGSLVMENSTKDFACKLIPIKEGRTFRKYTIKENKILKITEGKTSKGKSFEMILRK